MTQLQNNRTNSTIMSAVTTASTGTSMNLLAMMSNITVQATVAGTGAVTATVIVEFSNDGIGWVSDSTGTLSLTGTTTASSGFVNTAPWGYIRGRVTAISGTTAAVTVTVGGVI